MNIQFISYTFTTLFHVFTCVCGTCRDDFLTAKTPNRNGPTSGRCYYKFIQ